MKVKNIVEFSSLIYRDKQTMLAEAAGIDDCRIADVGDDWFAYRDDDGHCWSRSYAMVDEKITLGDAVKVIVRTEYEPVASMAEFALDADSNPEGDMVIRTGKIFEAGNYPDKGFAITEEELATAAASFSPVDNDLEHKPTILSGALGQLRSVIVRGKELFGTVAIPKWLNDAVGADPIKTSLAFARNSKNIVGNALVLSSRVPDAQLVAAFNAANSIQGGIVMPKVNPDEKKMGWWEKLTALFKANTLPEGFEDFDPEVVKFADDAQADPPAKPPDPAAPTDDAAKFAAAEQRNAALEARLLQTDAEKFFEQAMKDCKVFPVEKDALIAQFVRAAKDDNPGVACFSADGGLVEGERLKALRASVAARPAHKLTTEQIEGLDPAQIVVLSAGGGTGKMTKERKAELINKGDIKVAKEGK